MSESPLNLFAGYRPRGYAYRHALRSAESTAHARAIGLMAVDELEFLCQFARDNGLRPPRLHDPQTLRPEMYADHPGQLFLLEDG